MRSIVQDAQAPLRSQYKETPAAAMVTDHARTCGADPTDPFHSVVEPMDGCGVSVPVGVHRAVGGLHDATPLRRRLKALQQFCWRAFFNC